MSNIYVRLAVFLLCCAAFNLIGLLFMQPQIAAGIISVKSTLHESGRLILAAVLVYVTGRLIHV